MERTTGFEPATPTLASWQKGFPDLIPAFGTASEQGFCPLITTSSLPDDFVL
jgi:hypothetical protein